MRWPKNFCRCKYEFLKIESFRQTISSISFFCYFVSHLCLVLSTILFVCSFWYKWSFDSLIESIAVASMEFLEQNCKNFTFVLISLFSAGNVEHASDFEECRCFDTADFTRLWQQVFIFSFPDALCNFFDFNLLNRKKAALDDALKPIAEDYRRKENYFLMACTIMLSLAIIAINFFNILFQKNNLNLPLSYYILIFPFDSFVSINWLLNYLQQFVAVFLGGTFFGFNFSLTMLIINQSCFLIDSAFVQVKMLDEALQFNSDERHTLLCLRKMAEMIEDIIVWLKRTQMLLEINFLSEVTLLSCLLCLFSFEITNSSSGSLNAMVAVIYMLTQFFVFCWMGSYVTGRLESLSRALQGIGWDQMTTKSRKDLKLMLLIVQNIKGYHGIFKPIDLATFEDVTT